MARNSVARTQSRTADLFTVYGLWSQGLSPREIGERVGRSTAWVREILRYKFPLCVEDRHVPDAPRFRPPEPRAPADRELHRRIGSTQNVPDGWV